MADFYATYPAGGGGGVPIYSTLSAFPAGSVAGDLAVAADTGDLYEWTGSAWQLLASPGGALSITTFGATPNADGLSLSGGVLQMQPADATHSGGLKSADWVTFNSKQPAGNYITALTGDVTASGPGSVAATLATVNANVGTFASVTVNGKGLVTAATNLSGDITSSGAVTTLATVNSNVGSFTPAAITVNAKGLVTAASNVTTGNLTDVGTDGITITSGTGAVLGSGTSIAQHVADTTHNGYLSSTDWNTFNGKGSVSSVAMTVPTFLSVSGSPITTSGTLAVTLSGTALPIANGGTAATSAAAARVSLDIDQRSTFSDADYSALNTDRVIAQIGTMTAVRTVTLPAANTLNSGQSMVIIDQSGTVTTTNMITVAAAGADTINGSATKTIRSAYGYIYLYSNGSNGWTAGVEAIGRGGTGLSTLPADGQLLIGSTANSNYALATITAGTGMSVTNGSGSITLATTGAPPTGAAGGDLGGTYPNPTVLSVTNVTTGVLKLANGGTNGNITAAAGAIAYSTASAIALTGAGNTGQILRSAGTGTPIWTTATYPTTVSSQNLLLGTSSNVVGGLAPNSTSALVTSSGSNISWTSGGTANRVLRTNGTTISFAQVALASDVSGVLPEANGGTNQSTYTLGDTLYASAANTLSKLAGNTTTTVKVLTQTGTGTVSAAPVWGTLSSALTAPLVTKYTSSSGTHTFTGSPLYVRVICVGGGGGGGGSQTGGTGGTGGNSSFGTTLITANGGTGGGGASGSNGGSGGSASLGSGPVGIAVSGGAGTSGTNGPANPAGGTGGSNTLGGAGLGGAAGSNGGAGATNSGAGGGGAGGSSLSGCGGGSGGYVDAIISGSTLSGMSGSAAYAVGGSGTAGTIGSGGSPAVGGAGAAGVVVVYEYYQ